MDPTSTYENSTDPGFELGGDNNSTVNGSYLSTTTEMATYVWKRNWLQNVCYWYSFTMYIVITGCLCISGLVGNTLTRLTMWPDRTKSATVFLLICLTIVDDLVLVVYGFMLMTYMMSFMDDIKDTGLPDFMARIWNMGWALGSTLQVASTWMTLVVSIQRYIAICQPAATKKYNTVRDARVTASIVLLSSLMFNFPRFFKYELQESNGRLRNVLTKFADSESYRVGYELIAYYVLVYLIPMVILVYTTVRLLLALRQSRKKRAQMITNHQNSTTSKKQDELTRSIVVVVILFCVCQVTNPIRRILEEVLPPPERKCGSFYSFYASFTGVLVIFNSAVNFVVFCACARGFRKQLMTRLGRNRQVHSELTAGASTVTAESRAATTARLE